MKAEPLHSSSQEWMTTLSLFGNGAHNVHCYINPIAHTLWGLQQHSFIYAMKKNSSVGTLLSICPSKFIDTNNIECAILWLSKRNASGQIKHLIYKRNDLPKLIMKQV